MGRGEGRGEAEGVQRKVSIGLVACRAFGRRVLPPSLFHRVTEWVNDVFRFFFHGIV